MSEVGIVQAMRMIWEVMKLIVKPSGAVSHAAAVERAVDAQGNVGVVLSGGSLDLERLPWQM